MTSWDTVRARFARDEVPPFAEVLTEASIRAANGLAVSSPNTASYCNAHGRM